MKLYAIEYGFVNIFNYNIIEHNVETFYDVEEFIERIRTIKDNSNNRDIAIYSGECKILNIDKILQYGMTLDYINKYEINIRKKDEHPHIAELIKSNEELVKLYINDPVFKKSIDCAIDANMSVQETLIFALVNGYKAKEEINNSFIEYAKNNLDLLKNNRELLNIDLFKNL